MVKSIIFLHRQFNNKDYIRNTFKNCSKEESRKLGATTGNHSGNYRSSQELNGCEIELGCDKCNVNICILYQVQLTLSLLYYMYKNLFDIDEKRYSIFNFLLNSIPMHT